MQSIYGGIRSASKTSTIDLRPNIPLYPTVMLRSTNLHLQLYLWVSAVKRTSRKEPHELVNITCVLSNAKGMWWNLATIEQQINAYNQPYPVKMLDLQTKVSMHEFEQERCKLPPHTKGSLRLKKQHDLCATDEGRINDGVKTGRQIPPPHPPHTQLVCVSLSDTLQMCVQPSLLI